MSRLQAVPDEPSFKYPDNPIGIERALHAKVQPPSKPGLKVLKLTSTPEMSQLIVQIVLSKDKAAFATLFEYFAPRLKSMLIGSGTDTATAEELAQEAMLSVWRKADRFDPAKASASTWIFTIARNLRIDRFRSERRHELDPKDPTLIPENEVPADDQLSLKDRQVVVRKALSDLPDDQRNVVQLSFIEGLSHQEISDRLELPLGTVKSRLRLSFEKLKTQLRSEI